MSDDARNIDEILKALSSKELLYGILPQLATSQNALKDDEIIQTFFSARTNGDRAQRRAEYLTAVALSLVRLYRRGILPELARAPEDFVADLFSMLLEVPVDVLTEKFRALDTKNTLSQSTWVDVLSTARRTFSLILWAAPTQLQSDKELVDLISSIGADGRTPRLCQRTTPQSYDEYLRFVDSELQREIEHPDIVLIDSILVDEFRSKGVIASIQGLLTDKQRAHLDGAGNDFARDGQGGAHIAVPVTRNFHLPACGTSFDHLSHNGWLDNIKKSWDPSAKKLTIELLNDGNTMNPWTPSALRLTEKLDWDASHSPPSDFHLSMGESCPFIPMQLARGPHVVYTLFSYLANGGKENSPIAISRDAAGLKSRRTLGALRTYKVEELEERLLMFLKLVFAYVPDISLCLDQLAAGYIRDDHRRDWFDPCLPIEAAAFQKDCVIAFGKEAVTFQGRSLSCLGGYCLGITGRVYEKRGAIQAAFELADSLYEESAKKFVTPDAQRRSKLMWKERAEINCKLRHNKKDSPTQDVPDYIDTPEDVALRPPIAGWRLLEEQISEVVRPYVLAVLTYRNLSLEARKKNISCEERQFPEALSFKGLQKPADLFVQNFVQKLSKKSEDYLRKKQYDDHTRWVSLNLESLEADLELVGALLTTTINTNYDSNKATVRGRHEVILKSLATRMAKALHWKIKATCLELSYEVNDD